MLGTIQARPLGSSWLATSCFWYVRIVSFPRLKSLSCEGGFGNWGDATIPLTVADIKSRVAE